MLMPAIVECVPNFSEGRDKARVDAIVEAMKMDGVYLLDREMDADHNRCVITLVGDPVNVAEAAIRGVGKAAELIDLTKHTGAHPRLGAADVIPFIPIEGVTIEDCVAIARRTGEEIWKRYQVPVYLYEAAAQKPERQNLENVRRGQFEGIREDIKTNPARLPDFGEAALHPTAGATIVGARKFLVAYNVYLNTPDVEIAKKIGKAVRFSNGGLRYVKGMGVPVRGRFVEVHGNLVALPDLLTGAAGDRDTILDGHAFDRNERDDIGSAESRVRARVLGEVDQLGGLTNAPNRSFGNVNRIADQGDDAAVVISVHLAIEEIDSVHLHGFDNGVDASLVAPFGEVRDTFDDCWHKHQDKTEGQVLLRHITGACDLRLPLSQNVKLLIC